LYGISVFVLVAVATGVLVNVGELVIVGGSWVKLGTIAGGAKVGGKILVAVFSGVGGTISVAVGSTEVVVKGRLQLNKTIPRIIIPAVCLIPIVILSSLPFPPNMVIL
jgi:hypothetical protein